MKAPCRVCKELILKGAKKCTHCECYQDWRQYLGSGEFVPATLAILLAFYSVVSSTLPALILLFNPHSNVHVEFKQSYQDRFDLFASNPGNKTGRLVSADMVTNIRSLSLQVASDGSIGAESAGIVVPVNIHPESLREFLDWSKGVTKCTLRARVADHGALPRVIDIDCTGENFQRFCRGSETAAIYLGKVQALAPDSAGRSTSRCP